MEKSKFDKIRKYSWRENKLVLNLLNKVRDHVFSPQADKLTKYTTWQLCTSWLRCRLYYFKLWLIFANILYCEILIFIANCQHPCLWIHPPLSFSLSSQYISLNFPFPPSLYISLSLSIYFFLSLYIYISFPLIFFLSPFSLSIELMSISFLLFHFPASSLS